MATIAFDSLGYFERLKAAGVSSEQAKVQADVMREIIEEKLATKSDLERVRFELDAKIEATKLELKQEIREMELRITIRLGGMMAASIAMVAALVKLL